MWSAGCILYSLLSGSQAFNSDSERGSLRASILHGNFIPMAGQRWRNVGDNAIALLRRLLKVNAKLRPTAEQALADPWFTSDPFLVNEATMVMEGIKKQADVSGGDSSSLHIDSPMRKMGLTWKANLKHGIATDVRGEKRKSPSEENEPHPHSTKVKLKRPE